MNRYSISIGWRGYRWIISGSARHGADLVVALAQHFPGGARISVTRDYTRENNYAERAIRRDQIAWRPEHDTDVFGRALRPGS